MDSRMRILILLCLVQWMSQRCSAADPEFQPFEAISPPLGAPPLEMFSDEVKYEPKTADKKASSYEVVETPEDLSRLPPGVAGSADRALLTSILTPTLAIPQSPEEEKAVSASNLINLLAPPPPPVEPERKMFTEITRSVPVINYLQGIEKIREEPKKEEIDKETLEKVFGEPPKPLVPEVPKPLVPEPPKPIEPPKYGEKFLSRGSRWAMYFGNVFVRGLSDLLGGARSALDEYIRPPKE